jgi:hypothetical protein
MNIGLDHHVNRRPQGCWDGVRSRSFQQSDEIVQGLRVPGRLSAGRQAFKGPVPSAIAEQESDSNAGPETFHG